MRKILLVLMVCFAATAQAQTRFIRNDSAATLQGTNLEISSGSVTATGALQCSLDAAFQSTNSAIRAEDTAHASGQSGIMALGVRNDALNTLAGTDADYSPLAVGARGNLFTSQIYDSNIGSLGPVRLEDSVSGDAAPGMNSLSTINITSAVKAADGDFTSPAVDTAGRTITAASASGSIVVGCNTAIVTATTGTVIAAVASNFTFITTLSCTNTGAAATRVILEDSDGTDLANVMLAATTGFATISFGTPVRTNVVNRAIQINVITTSSSTICCASGFTGII